MVPGYTTKRGVRYRFYTSAAILSGRRNLAGTVTRTPAAELEDTIFASLHQHLDQRRNLIDRPTLLTCLERIVLYDAKIALTFKSGVTSERSLAISWTRSAQRTLSSIEYDGSPNAEKPNPTLARALAEAHLWLNMLSGESYRSISQLATDIKWNPKVLRKRLRLAFLAPDLTEAIICGRQPQSLNLSQLLEISTIDWEQQRQQFFGYQHDMKV